MKYMKETHIHSKMTSLFFSAHKGCQDFQILQLCFQHLFGTYVHTHIQQLWTTQTHTNTTWCLSFLQNLKLNNSTVTLSPADECCYRNTGLVTAHTRIQLYSQQPWPFTSEWPFSSHWPHGAEKREKKEMPMCIALYAFYIHNHFFF